MSSDEILSASGLFLSMMGLNNPIIILGLIAAISAALRLLPWEKDRPWRRGFFLVAPLIAALALAVALAGGVGIFYFIMFGIFEDRIAMPWLTFLPALGAGHMVAIGLGALVAIHGGRMLKHV